MKIVTIVMILIIFITTLLYTSCSFRKTAFVNKIFVLQPEVVADFL